MQNSPGTVAVVLPNFRWLSGMRWRFATPAHAGVWSIYQGADAPSDDGETTVEGPPTQRGPVMLDLDHPGTAGCLLALLGPELWASVVPGTVILQRGARCWWAHTGEWHQEAGLGHACFAVARHHNGWSKADQ